MDLRAAEAVDAGGGFPLAPFSCDTGQDRHRLGAQTGAQTGAPQTRRPKAMSVNAQNAVENPHRLHWWRIPRMGLEPDERPDPGGRDRRHGGTATSTGRAHKNEIIGNAMRREDGGVGRFTYRMEEDLETALTGADSSSSRSCRDV